MSKTHILTTPTSHPLPDGINPSLRWMVYLVNQIGVPVLALGALAWFTLHESTEHRQERRENASRLEEAHAQVLMALQQNTAALTRQSEAMNNLCDSLAQRPVPNAPQARK
jgi:hypothetical protein